MPSPSQLQVLAHARDALHRADQGALLPGIRADAEAARELAEIVDALRQIYDAMVSAPDSEIARHWSSFFVRYDQFLARMREYEASLAPPTQR